MPGTKDGGPNLGSAQFSVFDCPPDTLDAISQAWGPWLAASSIGGSPLEAPPGPGRQAAGRALSWLLPDVSSRRSFLPLPLGGIQEVSLPMLKSK